MYIRTVHYWEREYHGPLARVEAVVQPTMHWLPIDVKQRVYTVGTVKDSYLSRWNHYTYRRSEVAALQRWEGMYLYSNALKP